MKNYTWRQDAKIDCQKLRVYEFVSKSKPDEILQKTELATGLHLQAHPLGQHGFIHTIQNKDGSRTVSIGLYEECLNIVDCPTGHISFIGMNGELVPGIKHLRAPDFTAKQCQAIIDALAK